MARATLKNEPNEGRSALVHNNAMLDMIRMLDIEIYDPTENKWAQARYLVHGHDDVLWTDEIEEALNFLRESAKKENDTF